MSTPDLSLRVAAALFAFTALGFGLPAIHGIRHLAAGRGVPLVFGFPAYGGGPFERMGIKSTVLLVVGFLLVCALELVAAALLWFGQTSGAILGLALLVPGTIYWWGFALPIPPILAVVRTLLILWRWSRLE